MATETKKMERVTSRIGDLPIEVPAGVEITREGQLVIVKGKKGTLQEQVPDGIDIKLEDGKALVVNANGNKRVKPFHGLMRALLYNMVKGVTDGFQKNLNIIGVGYRAAIQGKTLEINVGYSNPVQYPVPDDVSIEVEQNTTIKVSGIDKSRVGQVASEIRQVRPPEPYKGKGIRYEGEYVRKKVGKSGT